MEKECSPLGGLLLNQQSLIHVMMDSVFKARQLVPVEQMAHGLIQHLHVLVSI